MRVFYARNLGCDSKAAFAGTNFVPVYFHILLPSEGSLL